MINTVCCKFFLEILFVFIQWHVCMPGDLSECAPHTCSTSEAGRGWWILCSSSHRQLEAAQYGYSELNKGFLRHHQILLTAELFLYLPAAYSEVSLSQLQMSGCIQQRNCISSLEKLHSFTLPHFVFPVIFHITWDPVDLNFIIKFVKYNCF